MRMCRLTLLCLLTLAVPSGAQTLRTEVAGDRALSPHTLGGFGTTVVFEDGTLYVGRPGEYSLFPMNATRTGAVHVFDWDDTTQAWIETQAIASETVEIGDGFGSALAVDGDWMLVGAPKKHDEQGATYVFQRVDGRWQEIGVVAIEGAPGDEIGYALALDGDLGLVASPGTDGATGTVQVITRGGSGWASTAALRGSDLIEGDRFGSSVSLQGTSIMVGAPGSLPGLLPGGGPPDIRSGSVHFFRESDGGWAESERLPGPVQSSFGWALSQRGGEAFVSAPFAGGGVGSVFRYSMDAASGTWQPLGSLVPSSPIGAGFGFSLAHAGSDLFVGAPLAGLGGVAYVFRRVADGAWEETEIFQAEASMAFFGASVTGMEGVAVLGSPGADVLQGLGHVYVQDEDSGDWTERVSLADAGEVIDPVTGEMVECQNGAAHTFGCEGMDLVAFLPIAAVGGGRGTIVNDVWGWTDPLTGREIAIVGRNDATAFVDLSEPGEPVYLGELPLTEGAMVNMWRDIKVFADHAFIVADGAGAHGIQIFDLRQLRDVVAPPVTFEETAHYDGIFSAHNIVINEETGFAYAVGSAMGGETCGGGLHMVDVRDPSQPTFAGCFSDASTGMAGTGYSHDAMCTVYRGPDEEFVGREICFGSNETAISIADVSDKANPVSIGSASYPNVGYLHQGWISDDHRYFYMNDELDELSELVSGTRTLIWDIQELGDPILVKEHIGATAASDHNLYVAGNLMYQSNYVSGLRVLDVSDPENPVEVSYFDTVPGGEDTPGFAGSWSNYPFFDSGLIVVTSIREGLFILKRRPPIS